MAAERDKRAGDKAVAGWARDNAADLRQLAGQIGALADLSGAPTPTWPRCDALGGDDPADLLERWPHRGLLQRGHPGLADQIRSVDRHISRLRRDTHHSRHLGD